MARIQDPILFSKYFSVDSSALERAELIDPFINVDTKLFIDHVLLEKSSIATICADGIAAFRNHFSNFVRLIAISDREGDAAAQLALSWVYHPSKALPTCYHARVLVEMKRSSGAVRHGYEKQLEIYLDASRTSYGIFVVMDFGDLGVKLDQITQIRRDRRAAGERASDIVVIDATKKPSASKR